MVNVSEPDDPAWFASPAKVYDAVDVPAPVLDVYVGVRPDKFNPPAPVTAAEHGVCAEPENVVVFGEHVTVVVDAALAMTNVVWLAEDPLLYASPANEAFAVAVPAFVFEAYVTVVAIVETAAKPGAADGTAAKVAAPQHWIPPATLCAQAPASPVSIWSTPLTPPTGNVVGAVFPQQTMVPDVFSAQAVWYATLTATTSVRPEGSVMTSW